MDMKFFLRMLIVSTVVCGISCSSNESKGNAEGQETDPQNAEAEVEAPAEVKPANAAFIVISKESMTLALYDFRSQLLAAYPMACGKTLGNKEKPGDMKTPEGVFSIQQIQDAHTWSHDFGDGKGEIKGAYGSHFIRLKTPGHTGIGIHGTHDPSSIGTRATEGCIRLNNDNLLELVKVVYVGMPVIITTSEADSKVLCKMPAAARKGPKITSLKMPVSDVKTSSTPNDDRSKSSESQQFHVVKSGETLSVIAEHYGMSLSRLRALNPDIASDRIDIGQKIVVEPKK